MLKVMDHDWFRRWIKIYCNCQEFRMNLENFRVNLFCSHLPPKPLLPNSIEVDQKWGDHNNHNTFKYNYSYLETFDFTFIIFSFHKFLFWFCICFLEQIKVLWVRYIGPTTRYSQYSSCPNTLSAIFIFVRPNIPFIANNISILILNTFLFISSDRSSLRYGVLL